MRTRTSRPSPGRAHPPTQMPQTLPIAAVSRQSRPRMPGSLQSGHRPNMLGAPAAVCPCKGGSAEGPPVSAVYRGRGRGRMASASRRSPLPLLFALTATPRLDSLIASANGISRVAGLTNERRMVARMARIGSARAAQTRRRCRARRKVWRGECRRGLRPRIREANRRRLREFARRSWDEMTKLVAE